MLVSNPVDLGQRSGLAGVVWLLQWTMRHVFLVWVRGYWGIEWKTWNEKLYLVVFFVLGLGLGTGKGALFDGKVG
jgi:hypothetical protein